MYALLSWRYLQKHRLRTVLSALAVALGVATAVAAEVTGAAIRNAGQAIAESGNTVAFVGDFLETGLDVMGLTILAAAAFLVLNAFGMAITQRQRQIGALRALGMTRGQILRLVLVEALLTGGIGTSLGLLSGPLLGRALVLLLEAWIGIAHGPAPVGILNLLRAAALGLGTTLLGTLIPALRATRVGPLIALRVQGAVGMEGSTKGWTLSGVLLILPLATYLSFKPPATAVLAPPWDLLLTGIFALGWLAGLGLLLPLLMQGLSAGLRCLGETKGATGRLAADNLGRARGRVLLTIATLAVALTAIVGVTGITRFSFHVTITQVIDRYEIGWIAGPIPSPGEEGSIVNWEILSEWDMATMRLSPEFLADLKKATAGRAHLIRVPQVVIPELAIMSGLPCMVVDPAELRPAGLFTFVEGNWATAQTIMESGCGLLLTPRMARSQKAWLYDTIVLEGIHGPVTCTVAGLGTSSFMGTSVVSEAAGPAFGLDPTYVFVAIVQPLPGVDQEVLRADLDALFLRYPQNSLFEVDPFFEDAFNMVDIFQVMLNGMLLLAIFAAALGVLNTTMISVSERRYELALLRAIGATRRQVMAVVAGEAALMGIASGVLGLIAGAGLTIIFVLVNGGNLYGFSDLPLWSSAWASVQPAIFSGVIGIVTAPLISAAAAWLPARALLAKQMIEALNAGRLIHS